MTQEQSCPAPELEDHEERYYAASGHKERNAPIPKWILVVYVSLAAWFIYYLYNYLY